ncbi:MAG: hypothetical protein Q8P67_02280 [archaeon]|nr:hypothetical protein [archaeon]
MASPAPKPLAGVEFPVDPRSKERSSTEPIKQVMAATFFDRPELREKLLAERNWRFSYDRWLKEHVKYSLQSPDHALRAAQEGLAEVYKTFEFWRNNNKYVWE